MTQKEFTLNQGQTEAADKLFRWMMRTDSKEIILSGPGGVGKSYLISYLIDVLIPKYHSMCELLNLPVKYDVVNLTATSNKAADILAEGTNRPVDTIHSLMGLVVSNDFSTGKTFLKRGKKWQMHQNKVIIVDEYSMENHDLYKHINESTYNCKVIHVGDHCQLSAVGDTIPYVSTLPIERIDLTEQMRTKKPELQDLFMQLRDSVETLKFPEIHLVPGTIDTLSDEEMQSEIEKEFLDESLCRDKRILAYSNGRVNLYNDFIRSLRNQPNRPVSGEHLICNSAYSRSNKIIFSAEEEVFIEHISEETTILPLPDNGELEVAYATLSGRFSGTIANVPIPIDRKHLDQLIRYYKKIKNWRSYFMLKEEFPDLRPREACTVHKSQGSSFDTVYIDAGDLSTCTNIATAARLLYVAVSRARNRVVFYGNLHKKLGGIHGQH